MTTEETTQIILFDEKDDRKHDAQPYNPEPVFEVKIVETTGKVGEGIMNAHVEYKIYVKTSSPLYKGNEFFINRRFKDFLWLREQLAETHKGYLIPPLPEKSLINRFNPEFVEFRRRELERFLSRIVSHPVLRNSTDLKKFFETESSDQLTAKTILKEQPQGGGFFSFLGSSITESISNLNFSGQKEPDQWFEGKKNYVNALETHLGNFEATANTVIKKHKELSLAYGEFATASTYLSSIESDHASLISSGLTYLADTSNNIADLNNRLAEGEFANMDEGLRDYQRIVGAVKEMLNARNEKLNAYQNATKQYEAKKEKLEKARTFKGEKELEEADKKVVETRNEFNQISEICKSELNTFEQVKKEDFRQMIMSFVKLNMDIEIQKVREWKLLLDKLADAGFN